MSTSNQSNISNETVEQTSSVDELSVQSPVIPNEEEESQVKILGLNWNTNDDCFSFDVIQLIEYLKSLPPTKRSILKISPKIFDPIGLISPITVNFKMWFQELCSSKVDWDVILSGSWLKKWNFLQNEVRALSELRVPRCYFVTELGKPVSHEIHGFSDSSEKTMAAVA